MFRINSLKREESRVQVVVRVRPASGPTAMALTESQSIRLHQDGVAFTVDGVLDHCSSQSDVFEGNECVQSSCIANV